MLKWTVDQIVRSSNPEIRDGSKGICDYGTLIAESQLEQIRLELLCQLRLYTCIILARSTSEWTKITDEWQRSRRLGNAFDHWYVRLGRLHLVRSQRQS